MRALALVCLASVVGLEAHAESPQLTRARKLVADLRYADAARALDAAWKTANNDRPSVLAILELTGVVQATLGNKAKAVEAFSRLHALAPNHPLDGDWGPRVMTPYYEGRSWAADHPVTLTLEPAGGGPVTSLTVKVTDSVRLGRSVRFHVKIDDGPWAAQQADLADPSVTLKAGGRKVAYWVELIGERNSQLYTLGSQSEPRLAGAEATRPTPPPTVAATDVPTRSDPLEPPPPRRDDDVPAVTHAGPSKLRPVAYVLVGAGAAAAIVGGVFGVEAELARKQLQGATLDANGRVTSLTQKRGLELEHTQSTDATLANALFIGGGALAVIGGVLWVVGAPPEKITLAPTPLGIVVVGELP